LPFSWTRITGQFQKPSETYSIVHHGCTGSDKPCRADGDSKPSLLRTLSDKACSTALRRVSPGPADVVEALAVRQRQRGHDKMNQTIEPSGEQRCPMIFPDLTS
jgi:hypothetical protein